MKAADTKLKSKKPTRLLWVDLEMTGLNPAEDVISEVAIIVTDFKFHQLEQFSSAVNYPKGFLEQKFDSEPNQFWNSRPAGRNDLLKSSAQSVHNLRSIEQKILALVKEYFKGELVILAGNSIRVDRAFIDNYMPELAATLHYRMLDVSSFKIWIEGNGHPSRKKIEKHRALSDIEESIAELKFYLQQGWLKID